MGHFLVYVRRSYKRADAADVSDEVQTAAALALLPADATHEVISDSGGHNSGATADRTGYQRLIARVRAGGVAGVAVYDLSRLARNAKLMLELRDELERRSVSLLIATMPGTRFDSAMGRYMFLQLCGAAQLQRDLDSERMRELTRAIFEAGGHRGLDPFGYRTVPGVRPRTLEVVEHEAAVVRLIWSMLAVSSTDEIADRLNRDGVRHRVDRPWTRDAVKDVVRRGRFYLGMVTSRRGLDERPGRHPAILDETTYRDGLLGSRRRRRGAVRRSTRHRVYLLSGVLECVCGTRMHGSARVSRGREWRYYLCRHCEAPSVPADRAEAVVLGWIATMRMPASSIDRARELLRERLSVPRDDAGERQRARLERRRARLAQLYAWGDLTEAEYRAQRSEVDAAIAEIQMGDKLVLFDRNRKLLLSMAENVEHATPAQRREFVALLVERAVAVDREVVRADWTPPAAPFFDRVDVRRAPPDGLEPPVIAPIDWYAA